MSDAKKEPTEPTSTTALAGELVRRLVPKEALLLGGFTVVVLLAGGAAVWAGSGQISKETTKAMAAEAKEREILEEKVDAHWALELEAQKAQTKAVEQLGKQLDRVEMQSHTTAARVEQFMSSWYAAQGRAMPALPKVTVDAGQ